MPSIPQLLLFLALCFLGGSTAVHGDHDPPEFGKPLWNSTYTDQLKRDLLATYDKFARPAQHTNMTTVTIDLGLKHVHLDDSKSLMTVNAWVKLMWRDEKLQWNSSDYGGLKELHLADHEIWQPDVVLYNSALGNNIDHYGNTHCIATPEGKVMWVPPTQFVVFCDMDLSKWPFDRHLCSLRLGSWTYSGDQVDLQISKIGEIEASIKTMEVTEWNVVGVSKRRTSSYYECCSEPYVDVTFNLTVERRSPSYRAIVILPAMCTILLTLSPLWLPPQSKERYLLCGITVILIALFLVYFSIRLPLIGPSTPLIVMFYASSLIMVCCTVVLTVVCYNVVLSQVRLPRAVIDLLRGRLSKVLLLPTLRVKPSYDEDTSSTGEELRDYEGNNDDRMILSRRNPQEGWILVTAAFDRIFFVAYLVVFGSLMLKAVL
ncbi:unnamed protein product [Nezara viridula]|uniref:Neurotransmitter-gated ion-channel ligand-binding domain-containing protein n=1 Tax=Nezara viridula TaxID=85310 RepID=A0A9P0HRM0_NEZVI|nr:unnamed protein product [Nezara viridula]